MFRVNYVLQTIATILCILFDNNKVKVAWLSASLGLESLQANPVPVELQIVLVVGQSNQNDVHNPPGESQDHAGEGDVEGNRLAFGPAHTSSALVSFSHLPLPHPDAQSVTVPQEDKDRHDCQQKLEESNQNVQPVVLG